MPETPPPPATSPTQPISLTETETSNLAAALNASGHKDAYGGNFTAAVIYAADTDANQRKRLLYLLALYAIATG